MPADTVKHTPLLIGCAYCGNHPENPDKPASSLETGETFQLECSECGACWPEIKRSDFGDNASDDEVAALFNRRALDPVREITDDMIDRGLAEYSEGGCMGLSEHERREVVTAILASALLAKGEKDHA